MARTPGLKISAMAVLGLVAVVTLAQTASLTRPLDVEWCFTRSDAFYQNPYNCAAFVRCVGGIKYEFDCPAGTRWNTPNNTCDHIYSTPCNTSISGPTDAPFPAVFCPPEVVDANQRDPRDCNRYYRCLSGVPHRQTCPAGQVFVTYTLACGQFEDLSPSDQAYCSAIPPTTAAPVPVCPAQVQDGTQRDPTNCGLYFRCVRGTQTQEVCPQNQFYNPAWGVCTPFNSLSQAERDFCNGLTTTPPQPPTTQSPAPMCPVEVQDGKQRDPSNCGRYFRCVRGTQTPEVCPQDLYFHPGWTACVPFNALSQDDQTFCNSLTSTAPPTTLAPTPLCPAEVQDGRQRDPSNCGRYFRCVWGTQTLETCEQDLVFNTAWSACMPFNTLSQAERDFCSGLTTVPPPTTAPTAAPDVPICPAEVVDGNQRDPTNCGHYYRCRRGVISLEACAQDLYFSVTWGSCVAFNSLLQAEKEFCITIPTRQPVCPVTVADGYQRDPQDCNRYFRCVNGASYPQQCPAGLYFNTRSTAQPCGQFEEMSASDQGFCASLEAERSTADVYCPPNVVGYQRDALNCSQYYWCVQGMPFLRRCDTGLFYVTSLQGCGVFNDLTATDKAYCSGLDTRTTPAPTVECPQNVLFAQTEHPTDCGKYYQCQNGVPQERQCGSGTFYSPQTFKCDPAELLFRGRYEQCVTGAPTTLSSATIVCQGNNEGLLMDFYDQNCRRYFDCRLNQVTSADSVQECPVGTHFNVIRAACTSFESLPPTFQSYCQRA